MSQNFKICNKHPQLDPSQTGSSGQVMHGRPFLFLCIAAAIITLATTGLVANNLQKPVHAATSIPPSQPAVSTETNPDAVCASCHKEIYDKYEQTPMAQASGRAVDGLIQSSFRHTPSGVNYRIFLRDDQAWMSYNREPTLKQPSLHGEVKLEYFIGSGHRGRTYLYQISRRWFEAPINYYSRKDVWDMAPGYGSVTTMPAALMIESNCLHCHTTDTQTALPQARNLYANAPFRQPGIGCIACHGDPAVHISEHGKGAIANPIKLVPARRDNICLQCHLEGDATVFRANTSSAHFRVGDDLDRYAVYFVRASAQTGGRRAISQYEALLRSACKIASGDKLTCISCHDPHHRPSESERVDFFRAKCLTCHTGSAMEKDHHPEQKSCFVCHMPTRNPTDVSHEQTTDHNIQRNPIHDTPTIRLTDFTEKTELVPVGRATITDRDLGIAYAQFAKHGDKVSGEKALSLLLKAEKEGADDVEVHVELGFLEQRAGDMTKSRAEYDAALRINPYEAIALGNLAVLEAGSGKIKEAIQLLQRVVDADPTQTKAGLNLAFIECSIGDKESALTILNLISHFAPDDPAIRKFMNSGIYAERRCLLH